MFSVEKNDMRYRRFKIEWKCSF